MRGTDAFPQVLEEARCRSIAAGVEIDFEATPVEQLDPARDAAELIVCCEVLEHLEDPDRALDVLASLARPWLIASSLLKSQLPNRLVTGMLSGSESRMPRTRSFSSSSSTISLMAGTG